MSYLTHRAEQAVLAALLADADPPLHLYGLTGEQFSSRLHREVFTALTDLTTTHPGLDPDDRDRLIAARVDLPGADPTDLATWRAISPDPQATQAYAELVVAAAVHRDVAAFARALAERIAHGDISDADPELAAHQRKLAVALTRHAEVFINLTGDTSPDVAYPATDVIITTSAGSSPWRFRSHPRTKRNSDHTWAQSGHLIFTRMAVEIFFTPHSCI